MSALSTVRRNTSCPQYSAVQYSTAQYSAAQYSTSPGPQQDPVTRTAAELGSLAPLPHNIASLFGNTSYLTLLILRGGISAFLNTLTVPFSLLASSRSACL